MRTLLAVKAVPPLVRMVAVVLVMLAWVLPMMPRQAAALSCVHPKDALPGYALLVKAKVIKVESVASSRPSNIVTIGAAKPVSITLAVERYYKGEGPAELHAVYDGMGWEEMRPVGSEIIMSFHLNEEKQFAAGPCSLMINSKPTNPFEEEMVTLIQQRYGEGKAPDAAAPVPSPPGAIIPEGKLGWPILWTSMGALALLVVGINVGRRRKG